MLLQHAACVKLKNITLVKEARHKRTCTVWSTFYWYLRQAKLTMVVEIRAVWLPIIDGIWLEVDTENFLRRQKYFISLVIWYLFTFIKTQTIVQLWSVHINVYKFSPPTYPPPKCKGWRSRHSGFELRLLYSLRS